MKQSLTLISAALLSMSVSAQSSKYIVANAYAQSGCDGKTNQISSINTGQCYYAKEECLTNPSLKPECDFLSKQSIGEELDVSFIASCDGNKIIAKAFTGKGCTDQSKAIGSGDLTIPNEICLLNFKLVCSNNPKYEIASSDASSIQGSLLGLLGLLFV